MEKTSYFMSLQGKRSVHSIAPLEDVINSFLRKTGFEALLILTIGAFALNSVSAQEWSEKDLVKSVHRAESTFESGEMSRAYGLYAHLVSVAGDRPFLHFRFGAICTFTGSRLDEAEDHLAWAKELGIMETEHAASWYYYTGKLRQLQYRFQEAQAMLDSALDLASGNENWLDEAKLRFGQCEYNAHNLRDVSGIELTSSLESHSSDFFRLYQLPQESGRLLITPESLLGKEDLRRGYTSIMHWLPGQRFAFFSSYGKKGDTGLDVYRVAVSSSGAYGIPEKLPEPVNSDFDDSHPICVPAQNAFVDPDLLYFSSSRPESMGGMDIFQVHGLFTGESLGMVARETLEQLPFEINSTRDEWLFWMDESTQKGWVSTNRSKGFEGKEIWQFNWEGLQVDPVAFRIELSDSAENGVLKILDEERDETILERQLEVGESWDLVVAGGEVLQFVWQGESGILTPLSLTMPKLNGGHIAMESALLNTSSELDVFWENEPAVFVPEDDLDWSEAALETRHQHGMWALETTDEETLAYRKAGHLVGTALDKGSDRHTLYTEANTDSFPRWFVDGVVSLKEGTWDFDFDKLISSNSVRSTALNLQNKLEALSCWEAPGSKGWKSHEALERFGEPVLASIAQEAYELSEQVENQSSLWNACQIQIERSLRLNPEKEREYIALQVYLGNQLRAYKGAENQSEDLIRRIEVHLQFERWLSDALPIGFDQEFQSSLVRLSLNDAAISKSLRNVAEAIASKQQPEPVLLDMQSIVWESLVDSIVDVQSLGVYDLPEMKPAQRWFLRSGGLMDELRTSTGQIDVISKGRRSVSLAWDALQEGKQKRDLVYADVQISSGEWWEKFGPRESEAPDSDFGGYELFVNGNTMLIEQAALYQAELDQIRLKSPQSKSGREAIKKAIAMRSNMATEMESMFGRNRGNSSSRVIPSIREEPSEEVRVVARRLATPSASKPSKVSSVLAEVDVRITDKNESIAHVEDIESFYTIQLGVFRNAPTWSFQQHELERLGKTGGLTTYLFGRYPSESQAKEALKSVVLLVPDAFVIPRTATRKQMEVSHSSNSNVNGRIPSTVEPSEERGRTILHRVKVASLGETLDPITVAKILRLGNEFNMNTVRLSNTTTYYSDSFQTEMEAIHVLDICLSNGFVDAVVEPVD